MTKRTFEATIAALKVTPPELRLRFFASATRTISTAALHKFLETIGGASEEEFGLLLLHRAALMGERPPEEIIPLL